jgi:hypothetical protein
MFTTSDNFCQIQVHSYSHDLEKLETNKSKLTSNENYIARGIVFVPHSQCSLRENPKFLQNF